MTAMTIIDLSVCEDCLMFIANGEIMEDSPENLDEQIDARWPSDEGWYLCAGSSEDEDAGYEEFSHRACEACGTHLGGQRHAAHAIKQ